MGLFTRRRDDTAELDRLRGELAELRARLDERDTTADTNGHASNGHASNGHASNGHRADGRAGSLASAPPPPPPPTLTSLVPAPPSIDPHALAIDELRQQVSRIDEQLAMIDHRVGAISVELVHQLTELSGELESVEREVHEVRELHERDAEHASPGDPIDPAVVDELRDAQIRLANEQARYQIAFRHDLASLAERLSRASGN